MRGGFNKQKIFSLYYESGKPTPVTITSEQRRAARIKKKQDRKRKGK